MANKPLKTGTTSLVPKEMQITTSVRYYFTLKRTAKLNNYVKGYQGCERIRTSIH